MTTKKQRYMPECFKPFFEDKDNGLLVGIQEEPPCAIGFSGRRIKPDFNFRFRSVERRNEYVAEWIKDKLVEIENKKKEKEERKKNPHALKLHDVLKSVWGYDQTNIDYYEVTALLGKTMVEVREIAQSVEGGNMGGTCAPIPGKYIGEPMRRRVLRGDRVRISASSNAYFLAPLAEVDGVRIYETDDYTSTH
jgi:hypothetical protein